MTRKILGVISLIIVCGGFYFWHQQNKIVMPDYSLKNVEYSHLSKDIKGLLEGHKLFKKNYFSAKKSVLVDLVKQGQKPKILFIACVDSRVDPAIIFNTEPGQLLVTRNVANLVPVYQEENRFAGIGAVLEFGTNVLEIGHIIVLGHMDCGGMQTLFKRDKALFDSNQFNFIAPWIAIAQPVYEKVMNEHADLSFNQKVALGEKYSLENSLSNLLSYPWIKDRVEQGKLTLHAWYFDLISGDIHGFDQEKNDWVIL